MSVFDDLELYITDEKFYIKPISNAINEVLVIDRLQQNDFKISNTITIPIHALRRPISGLVGTLKLLIGNYLIVIVEKSKVGTMNGEDVWRVEKFEMLAYMRNDNHLNEQQKKCNESYKSMIDYMLKHEHFYFSYTYDITHTLQRLQNTTPDFLMTPLYERADERFVWNQHLIRNFNAPKEISRYILPIMLGFISIKTCIINGKLFEFALISRRNVQRAGTRFNTRGIDDKGNVANFVETEQMVQYGDFRCSFVQIRGSIPLAWTQTPNLKYKPSFKLIENENHLEHCRKHFNELIYMYDKQVCVNLVNQHGSEGILESLFSDMVKSMNNAHVAYEAFDFHKQCGVDKWDRLSILINRLASYQDSLGYFCVRKDGYVQSTQNGIFRVNCIDCLDRTNVVQGLLAKRILLIQLLKLDILKENESIDSHSLFNNEFRNVWADNGDFISKQYAGTGALKSDFTRTGKRTIYGSLRDGLSSLQRYVLNNFYDGFKQDSIDLFLGNYQISHEELTIVDLSPILKEKDKRYLALPVVMFCAFSMFIISLLIPAQTYQEQFSYVLFWSLSTVGSLILILYFGHEFVDKPRLSLRKPKKE